MYVYNFDTHHQMATQEDFTRLSLLTHTFASCFRDFEAVR